MIRALIASALLLAACSSSDGPESATTVDPTAQATRDMTVEPTPDRTPEPTREPTQEPTPELTAQCDQAFAQAASIGDMEDTVEDLYAAVRACTSIEDWIAGSEANPGAISEGVKPIVFLGNVCGSLTADLEDTDLCQEVRSLCDTDDEVFMTMACADE